MRLIPGDFVSSLGSTLKLLLSEQCGPLGAKKSEFARISEKILAIYYKMLKKGYLIIDIMWIYMSVNYIQKINCNDCWKFC